jgi:hypothetical protein
VRHHHRQSTVLSGRASPPHRFSSALDAHYSFIRG